MAKYTERSHVLGVLAGLLHLVEYLLGDYDSLQDPREHVFGSDEEGRG